MLKVLLVLLVSVLDCVWGLQGTRYGFLTKLERDKTCTKADAKCEVILIKARLLQHFLFCGLGKPYTMLSIVQLLSHKQCINSYMIVLPVGEPLTKFFF